MGTQITIKLALGRQGPGHDAAQQVIALLESEFEDFGYQCWPWSGGSLSHFNDRLAKGQRVEIPNDLRALFARAWEIRQRSGGVFEPRLAPLVQQWGFHDFAAAPDHPPDAEEIQGYLQALRSAPDYDGSQCYGPAPSLGWDFGGIGKGWIIDRALQSLSEKGFSDAVIDAGGNLAVRGANGRRAWTIGIRRPDSDPENPSLLATVEACDEAVNTHGDDQRYFIHEERRYGHILDPFTGFPAQGLRSVTVVHPDGTLAEAAGAALFVAGSGNWRALARKLGLVQVMVVHDTGLIEVTEGLAPRLQLADGVQVEVVRLSDC